MTELAANMMVRRLSDETVWIIDPFGASSGQYNTGVVWKAKKVLTFTSSGNISLVEPTQSVYIDSIDDKDKYEFLFVVTPTVVWNIDWEDTEAYKLKQADGTLKELEKTLGKEKMKLLVEAVRSGKI